MNDILSQSLPIVALMAVGFLLRQVGIFRRDDGHTMARIIINTTLPALLFLSLARADVEPSQLLVLGLCGAAIPLVLHVVAIAVTKWMKLEKPVAGVVVVSAMVTNIGFFLIPFFLAFYGPEGVSRLAAFDLGNSLMTTSYAYYTATRYGNRPTFGWWTGLKRVLALPTFWANIFGIAVNLAGVALPTLAVQIIEPLSKANTPLAMLTLGSFIELRFANLRPMIAAVGLRIGGGLVVGLAIIQILGLTGLERAAIGLGSAMPIGVIVLVYASMEGLDTDFAAGAISLSILVALLLIPLLLMLY
jgi:hypothetical protein